MVRERIVLDILGSRYRASVGQNRGESKGTRVECTNLYNRAGANVGSSRDGEKRAAKRSRECIPGSNAQWCS